MNSRYFLADHVRASFTGRYCIFLDIQRDRYFSVPKDSLGSLPSLIVGIQTTHLPALGELADLAPSTLEAADRLVDAGLLSHFPPLLRPAPIVPPNPTRDAFSFNTSVCLRAAHGHGHLLRVLHALCHAQTLFSCRPFEGLIGSALKLKQAKTRRPSRPDVNEAVSLALTFRRYRPLFPRDYLCLFDSLALMHYLARCKVYATWVFGVREDPFSAHCWVQVDSTVLNDYCDRVAEYTPIMSL